MKTPVSYPLAKLLKEKGYDVPTNNYYEYAITSKKDSETNDYTGSFGWKKGETNLSSGYFKNNYDKADLSGKNWYMCSAPTIAEVIMWLYEKHGIWIVSSCELAENNVSKEWFWIAIKDGEEIGYNYGGYNSPTEAYEAAIEHTLKNIIKQTA